MPPQLIFVAVVLGVFVFIAVLSQTPWGKRHITVYRYSSGPGGYRRRHVSGPPLEPRRPTSVRRQAAGVLCTFAVLLAVHLLYGWLS